jgi:hypothetical protein
MQTRQQVLLAGRVPTSSSSRLRLLLKRSGG